MERVKKYLLTLLIAISAFLVGTNYVSAEGDPGEILIHKTATKFRGRKKCKRYINSKC